MTLFLLLILCVTETCNGCRAGQFFDKDHCKQCPENCAYCVSETMCSLCKKGYHGESCSLECSNCEAGTACDQNTGYCINSCKKGLSGEHCNITCNPQCKSCDRLNRNECIICTLDGHGIFCNKTCSSTCLKGLCNDNNGFCTYGCLTGYWGQTCENSCSTNCKNVACTTHNGTCLEGCVDGYYEHNCSRARERHVQWYMYIIAGAILIIIVVVIFVWCIKRNYLLRRFNLWHAIRLHRNAGIPQDLATDMTEGVPMLNKITPPVSNDQNQNTAVTSTVVNDEESTDEDGFPCIPQNVETDMTEGVPMVNENTLSESNDQDQDTSVTNTVDTNMPSEEPVNEDGGNEFSASIPMQENEKKEDNDKEDKKEEDRGTNVDTGFPDNLP